MATPVYRAVFFVGKRFPTDQSTEIAAFGCSCRRRRDETR